ncbi:MAG: aminotransferase class III-fold pyridoxal phosphate-dependent enzyme [Geminicoccaceae bacterium]
MSRAFFVSGGSEAVESALQLARSTALARGEASRFKIVSRFPSYHGGSLGALALTGYDPLTAPYAPMMREMPKIPAPRAWLDGLDPNDPATGEHYASMFEDKILEEGPDTVLAFIEEPIGGAATGALVPPSGYERAIRRICDRYGVLLIHDEVMSGAGRTGRFLACEHEGVAPDITVLSKGLGAGYVPLGAMLARDDIVDAVLDAGGFPHGFTYAGNPLACAAGVAVLDAMEEDGMVANAARAGAMLKARLEALAQRFAFIGDVRGKGLLLAFELVSDRATRRPLPASLNAFDRVVELAYGEGLILYSRRSRGGIEGDHILVCPPLIVTPEQIDEIAEKLAVVLEQFAKEIVAGTGRT